ncbi:MAG: ferredoxin-type protein NapF [Chromatiales bacterium]|nr:ferredoxin-type protein NapF [Chromatiales bacterium]
MDEPLRPPWAIPELQFIDACDRCGDCVSACPQKIINPGPGQYPIVDFTHQGCDFCGECVQVCKPGALKSDDLDVDQAWSVVAQFEAGCLSLNGIVCRACSDICEPRAIRFSLMPGGKAEPQLESEECTGCGECLAVCPVKTITFSNKYVRDQVA